MVGAQTFHHGTNTDAVPSILQTGLDPTRGGKMNGISQLDPKFTENSKGFSHIATGLQGQATAKGSAHLAQTYRDAQLAGKVIDPGEAMATYVMGQHKPNSKGAVISGAVPYEQFLNGDFLPDPDQNLDGHAFKTKTHIPASSLNKGDTAGVKQILKAKAPNVGKYIKQNPRRFTQGALLTGLGGAGLYGGYKLTKPLVKKMFNMNKPSQTTDS